MSLIGFTLTPGDAMSIRRNVMPSCFAASKSVRTRMNIQSALSAYEVQTFWPFSTKSSPSRIGLGLEAREVGARARLGVALAPADLAADDRRQVLLPELLAALLQEERPDHRETEADERRTEVELRHLLREDLGLLLREPAAAVLPRPRRRRPAALGHDREPAHDGRRGMRPCGRPNNTPPATSAA